MNDTRTEIINIANELIKSIDLVATEQWIINPSQAPLQVLYAIL
jgi:hypothetical protein